MLAACRRANARGSGALLQHAVQHRHMSNTSYMPTNFLWANTKSTILHVDEKRANRQFAKAVQQEHDRAYNELPEGHQLLFDRARSSGERAKSLMRFGRLKEAEEQALEALRHSRGVERDYGAGLSVSALRRIVTLYTSQSRFRDVEPFARELVDRLTTLLGTRHPMTLEPMQSLATVMASDGRFRQAADLLAAVHLACLDLYGAAHPATRRVASRLQLALSANPDAFVGQQAWLDRFFEGSVGPEPM